WLCACEPWVDVSCPWATDDPRKPSISVPSAVPTTALTHEAPTIHARFMGSPKVSVLMQESPKGDSCILMPLAVVDAGGAAPDRAPGRAGNAHGRQRTPDEGLGSRDEAVDSGYRSALAKFERAKPDDPSQQKDAKLLGDAHCVPPVTNCFGISPASGRSFRSIFLALVAFLKAK